METKVDRKGMIQIDEKYFIDVLPIDYALAEIKTGKDGKERKEHIAYYGNIGKCLKEYVHQAVHSDLAEKRDISLLEALKTAQQAVQRCITVINARFPDYEVVKRDNDNVLMNSRKTL